MQKTTTLDYMDWRKKYNPLRNPYRKVKKTFMFQNSGDDLVFVQKHPEARVWTLITVDDDLHIINGIHPGRAKGYFITHKPHPKNKNVEVLFQDV